MSKIVLHQGVFVLVCDGRKAMLLRNAGDHVYPQLETVDISEHNERPTHEMGTDHPGRTFSSHDGRRSSVEQTDFHEQSEERFLKAVAAKIGQRVEAHEIKKLIVVSPPHATGILRKAYTPQTRAAIEAEVEKDLVHLAVYEVEDHLKKMA
ncbi:MAG: host attachment protein [Alphaproteobacteria bacterium]|nr:host attachment protein [Alphaproteobacteria bacterium]